MEEKKLQPEITYTGTVLSVKPNADSYKKRGTETLMYCHSLLMLVDDQEYQCQQCSDNAAVCDYSEKEVVKFGVISFSKGVYTIKRLSSYGESASFNIEGTSAERALYFAVMLYAYRPEGTPQMVTSAAKEFKGFLDSNVK
jgi:hypothetical protein